jgi:hypothetical protein
LKDKINSLIQQFASGFAQSRGRALHRQRRPRRDVDGTTGALAASCSWSTTKRIRIGWQSQNSRRPSDVRDRARSTQSYSRSGQMGR